MGFKDFLKTEKKMTDDSAKAEIIRLIWIEDNFGLTVVNIADNLEKMKECRQFIYDALYSDKYEAKLKYKALRLYYEYIHGEICPRFGVTSYKERRTA